MLSLLDELRSAANWGDLSKIILFLKRHDFECMADLNGAGQVCALAGCDELLCADVAALQEMIDDVTKCPSAHSLPPSAVPSVCDRIETMLTTTRHVALKSPMAGPCRETKKLRRAFGDGTLDKATWSQEACACVLLKSLVRDPWRV